MKKLRVSLVLAVFLVTLLGASVCMAENFTPRAYIYTDSIAGRLTFSGGTANCRGEVNPTGSYSASVTIYLYRQNGTSWTFLDSWSSSATGGSTAVAAGSTYVGSGTFKLVIKGNVGNGLEYPTTTVTKTN